MTEQLQSNEYRCAMCKQVYRKGWSRQEAWAETQEYWPGVDETECEVICDDCWQEIRPERNVPEYLLSLLDLIREEKQG